MSKFIGRREELARLKKLIDRKSASLIVVRGRRRIGKSRLLAEFGLETNSLFFSGMPPSEKTTAQAQRDEFANQLARVGLPGIKSDDWGNMLWHLFQKVADRPMLIVLDEISWMGGKDPNFLGHLKTAWDMYFSKNPRLILALCGSISSWIEENILSSTGFVGRITLDMVLEELPLNVCGDFWKPHEARISPYDKFKVLAVTGGVWWSPSVRPIGDQIKQWSRVLKRCLPDGNQAILTKAYQATAIQGVRPPTRGYSPG